MKRKTVVWGTVVGLAIVIAAAAIVLRLQGSHKQTEAPPVSAETPLPSPTPSPTAAPDPSPQITGDPVQKRLADMTLKDKIAQMMFISIDTEAGTANAETLQLLKNQPIGGVILFRKDMQDNGQTVRLTRELQENVSQIPLLIGTDQEGGIITRLPQGTIMPGNMAVGATKSQAYAYDTGKIIGDELQSLGINLDFAPDLDVNNNPDNPVIGIRSFSSEPDIVSEMGHQVVNGLHDAGVIATGKHFPGHGDTDVDSHLGLPVILHPLDRLKRVELVPFQSAVDEGIDMIMSAHIVFPAIDSSTVISKSDGSPVHLPATLSHRVLTGLLREQLGFDGVIITDALNMGAIAQHFGKEQSVVMAVKAGADMLLMPPDPEEAIQAVAEAVNQGKISEERIDESARRILELKQKYHLLDKAAAEPIQSQIDRANQIVGSPEHHAMEKEIAEHAVTLVRNEGKMLPLHAASGQRIIVLAPDANASNAVIISLNRLFKTMKLQNMQVQSIHYQGMDKPDDAMLQQITKADMVILATNNINEQGSQKKTLSAFAQTAVKNMLEIKVPFAVIAIGNPYDLTYVPNAPNYVAIYGSSSEANMDAGIEAVFGAINPSGKLPVSIPDQQGNKNLEELGDGLTY